MLTVSQLSKSFAGRVLFEDVSLQVNRGDRVGLVGPNGAGKSTLFSLILGETTPDSGSVSVEKKATIGFLPQETAAAADETVLELAMASSPELVQAQQLIKRHESGIVGDDESYHAALHIFDEHGGWQLEPKALNALMVPERSPCVRSTPVSTMATPIPAPSDAAGRPATRSTPAGTT